MSALSATSDYHSKRKDISEDQNEIGESERSAGQDRKKNSRREIKSSLLISGIKDINVYKKRYNEGVWSRDKMSRSRIRKAMREIRLREQVDNFYLLRRVSVITIFAKLLSNSTSGSFKNLESNDVPVVERPVSKSIMALLAF